jgi:hypothetical protein
MPLNSAFCGRCPFPRCQRRSTQRYGTPLRPYLLFLIKRRKQLPEAIRRLQAEFLVCGPELSKRGLQIASQVALLYAGGCLAIEAHVLPWRREQLREALQTCLQAALDHVHRGHAHLKAIHGVLERRLQSPSIVEAASDGRFGPAGHPGFYREVDGQEEIHPLCEGIPPLVCQCCAVPGSGSLVVQSGAARATRSARYPQRDFDRVGRADAALARWPRAPIICFLGSRGGRRQIQSQSTAGERYRSNRCGGRPTSKLQQFE